MYLNAGIAATGGPVGREHRLALGLGKSGGSVEPGVVQTADGPRLVMPILAANIDFSSVQMRLLGFAYPLAAM